MPDELTIPADKTDIKIELSAAEDAAAQAFPIAVLGTAHLGEEPLTRSAGNVLVATTMKPPFTITAEGKDDS